MFSQRHFPNGDFPSDNFSQVSTSQMCNFQNGNFSKVRLGLLGRRGPQLGPGAAARTCLGPSTAARTDFGSCHLGNTIRNWPLGKMSLGKYLTSLGQLKDSSVIIENNKSYKLFWTKGRILANHFVDWFFNISKKEKEKESNQRRSVLVLFVHIFHSGLSVRKVYV